MNKVCKKVNQLRNIKDCYEVLYSGNEKNSLKITSDSVRVFINAKKHICFEKHIENLRIVSIRYMYGFKRIKP